MLPDFRLAWSTPLRRTTAIRPSNHFENRGRKTHDRDCNYEQTVPTVHAKLIFPPLRAFIRLPNALTRLPHRDKGTGTWAQARGPGSATRGAMGRRGGGGESLPIATWTSKPVKRLRHALHAAANGKYPVRALTTDSRTSTLDYKGVRFDVLALSDKFKRQIQTRSVRDPNRAELE